ncbi:MAG: hypothetical protein HKO64_09880 [Xanthomonadales bacterium]|nr:hypothetical protein [Xanthomonadales bacterium]
MSALLMQSLKEEKGLTGLEILNDIVTQLDHPKPEVVIEGGRKLLVDLRHRDVILGTQP